VLPAPLTFIAKSIFWNSPYTLSAFLAVDLPTDPFIFAETVVLANEAPTMFDLLKPMPLAL
jgi:hypothetical protein